MSTTESKAPNYSEAQASDLKEKYLAAPTKATVDALALEHKKSSRSIVAKLSNMGIYKTPPRLNKAGGPIVKKETLVAEICEKLGVVAPSLVKANKQDLERLAEVIAKVETYEC